MLVLTRRKGEAIVIDDKIFITVLKVTGTQVKLSIVAPDDVPICRSEIKDNKNE